jgi:predicted MPP superfamily phosphohydrolase
MRRRLATLAAIAALGGMAAVATLGLTSRTEGPVGPGQVEVSARWRWSGRTALLVPPLGTVSAATHDAPLGLRAQVTRLDVDQLESLVTGDRPDEVLRDEAADDLGPLIRSLAVRALVAALIVGGLVGALVPHRRWTTVLAGAAGGVAVVALLLAVAWRDYQVEAFEEARFDGALERAPQIARTLQRHVDSFDEVRSRIEALGLQVTSLYAATTTDQVAASSGETVILHVSDIHSNPVGLEVVDQLASQFEVDAVLDTGDLTSFGLPLESRITALVARIRVPYLLVPGNHDSPTNRRAFRASGAMVVLNGQTVDVDGIDILGVGDPNYTADNELDRDERDLGLARQRDRIRQLVDRHRPDVLAVHNPVQAVAADGEVPLVVAGHVHERRFEELDGGTLVLTSGSTGATGIGAFTTVERERYEAQLLRFVGSRLVAVDAIEMEGVDGGFRIERRLVERPDE